jgi:hypothetical protein
MPSTGEGSRLKTEERQRKEHLTLVKDQLYSYYQLLRSSFHNIQQYEKQTRYVTHREIQMD